MSVIVKGMKIPDSCFRCPFKNHDGMWVRCIFTGQNVEPETRRETKASSCPLIEVPTPHGDLIDRDALAADLKRQCKEVFKTDAVSPDDFWITRNQAYNERLWTTWCESFFSYLKAFPTIIPAEEEVK